MPTRRPRFPRLSGLVAAVAAAVPCLLLPWILPPPPAVQAAVMMILAGQGYAAAALVRAACGRLRRQPGISPTGAAGLRHWSPSRRLTVTAVFGLLLAAYVPAPVRSPQLSLAGVTRGGTAPPSALRSENPGSLIAWDSLGAEGQKFMAGPGRERIVPRAERPAFEPVRAYVGLRSARTAEQRARLAVTELERDGGFARSTILVVVPTGSGWVNPAAVAALEYLSSGDLATIAMQYAELPSWEEYLLGSGRAAGSATALVVALRHRLAEIPPGHRPRLLIYGESLGAIAARCATTWTDQALLVGAPGAAGRHRDQGRSMMMLHADDPVGWWSPRLLFQRPEGWPGGWLPVVSFWQVTGSLLTAVDAPAGHGHHYGNELIDAWQGMLRQGRGLRP